MAKVSLSSPGVTPESVELRGVTSEQLMVHSSRRLAVGAPVRVRRGHRHSPGVVEKCEMDRFGTLLTIKVTKGNDWLLRRLPRESSFDPGALAVDDFLSIEQLSFLVAELGANSHNGR